MIGGAGMVEKEEEEEEAMRQGGVGTDRVQGWSLIIERRHASEVRISYTKAVLTSISYIYLFKYMIVKKI